MLFLSLSSLIPNIARTNNCLWSGKKYEYLFISGASNAAYLSELQPIKACKPEYTIDSSFRVDDEKLQLKLNSGKKKRQTASLK